MKLTTDRKIQIGIWLAPIIISTVELGFMIRKNHSAILSLQEKMTILDQAGAVEAAVDNQQSLRIGELAAEQVLIRQTVQGQAIDIAAICQATGARCQ